MRNNTLALASLSASVCLSVYLSVCLCLSVSLSVTLSRALSLSRTRSLSLFSHVPLSRTYHFSLAPISLCFRLSASVCLSICLSARTRARSQLTSFTQSDYLRSLPQATVSGKLKDNQTRARQRVACRAAYASISLGADPSEP